MRRLLPLLLVAAASAADSPRPEYRRAALVERPPFSKSDRRVEKSADSGPLELRGFFGSGTALEASVTRSDTRESRWLRLGDTTSTWVLEAADPEAGTADVRFEGMRLHLTLARPEIPKVTAPAATPDAPKTEEPADAGRGRRGGRLSSEARSALREAMTKNMQQARSEHPEYFDGTKLSAEQQQARSEYMRTLFTKTREEIAKNHPADAQAISDMESRARAFRGGDPAPRAPGDRPADEPPRPAPAP